MSWLEKHPKSQNGNKKHNFYKGATELLDQKFQKQKRNPPTVR